MRDKIAMLTDPLPIVFADGLDDAIVGIDAQSSRVVYSVSKCIDIMAQQMSVDDAIEWLEYNTFSAYVGEFTPIWLDDRMLEC